MTERDFDLNLLKVLIALLQEKNTSRAAELLDTSQPSVSRALAKLRVQLDDPLFYRDKGGLKLSPKAESLAESLPPIYKNLLDTFEDAVFEPENYKGKIRIAMNAYVTHAFGSKIFLALKESMPNLTVELLNWNERSSEQILEEQVDIAISFFPMDLLKGIYERQVSTLKFGFIVNKQQYGHISSIDFMEAAKKYGLCTVLIPEYNSQSLQFEKKTGTKVDNLNLLLKSHTIRPIFDLVKESGAFFIAPEILYERVNKNLFHFIHIDNLTEDITHANVGLMYNAKNRTSPVFKWLEQEIVKCLRG